MDTQVFSNGQTSLWPVALREHRSRSRGRREPSHRDVIGWDAVNWSAALDLWRPHVAAGTARCLELGCGPGGVSLWLAAQGNRVLCSDLELPDSRVRDLHARYGVQDYIDYAAIDCTKLDYTEEFDVIVLKSVLGGVWAHCGLDGMRAAIQGIRRALRPHGKFLFVENLRATPLHMFCRRRILGRGPDWWMYPSIAELKAELAPFSTVQHRITGLLGTFGRTEWQRSMLGYLDKALVPLVPQSWRYIMAGVAEK